MYYVFGSYDEAREYLPEFESEAAQKLKAEAAKDRQYAADSFERCDTDGFLSQWACGITASEKERKASLANRGGLDIFPALMDEAGNIHARIYTFPNRFSYGTSQVFKVSRGEKAEWVNAHYAKDSTYAKKGLKKVYIIAPAKVMSDPFNRVLDKRTGLSGCAGYSGMYPQLDCEAAGL